MHFEMDILMFQNECNQIQDLLQWELVSNHQKKKKKKKKKMIYLVQHKFIQGCKMATSSQWAVMKGLQLECTINLWWLHKKVSMCTWIGSTLWLQEETHGGCND